MDMEDEGANMEPLFQVIIKRVKAPTGFLDMPLQMLVTTLDSNEYVGTAIGKIDRGRRNQQVALVRRAGTISNVKYLAFMKYQGCKRRN